MRLAGLNCITRGDYRGGIDIARRSLAADPGEPQYQTMLGFFLEQSGFNDEGLAVSRRSLARDPTNLYTYHAVGHAYQARGDYRNALETFERAASLERYPHLLWHLAEAQALLGHERLTRDYWASTAPPLPLHERIELVWRLEVLRGRHTDDAIWRDLAREAERAAGAPRVPDDLDAPLVRRRVRARRGTRTRPRGRSSELRGLPGGARGRSLVDAGRVHPRGRARDDPR